MTGRPPVRPRTGRIPEEPGEEVAEEAGVAGLADAVGLEGHGVGHDGDAAAPDLARREDGRAGLRGGRRERDDGRERRAGVQRERHEREGFTRSVPVSPLFS